MKRISIIIATYNADNFLAKCLESITSQKESNIEIILIDGGSKDSTVDIIKSYSDVIDFWISEKDNGIYDAWNKGVKKAKGKWIMFLGADDELVPGTLQKYLDFINNSPKKFDLISSRVQMIDFKGRKIRVIGYPYQWPQFQKSMLIAHPGSLHSKKLFDTYGYYNTSYKIVGDYEFLLRAGSKLKAAFLPEITVIMREGGASDSINAVWEAQKAASTTGRYNKFLSILNAYWTISKFRVKKIARGIGLNVYLKR